MKICRTLKKTVSIILVLAFIFALISPMSVFGDSTISYNVNFGVQNGRNNVTLKPSEVLVALYGEQSVSEGERGYVDTYVETVPIYACDIYADRISVNVDGAVLAVSAREKVFNSGSDRELLWIPTVAHYGTQQATLTKDNGYSAEFEFVDYTSVTVDYTAQLVLPSDYVLYIANLAFNDKSVADASKEKYEALLAEYLQKNKEYREYCDALSEYEAAARDYAEYMQQKQLYDERLEEYKNYIEVLLPEYERSRTEYEAYLAAKERYELEKVEWEKNYDKNLAEYAKYTEYLNNLTKIRTSMAAMESIYVTPSNGVGPLFDALQSAEIIGMIEKYQDTLVVLYGVKKQDIVDMRAISDALTQRLIEYGAAREISDEAAFAYYKQHYADITEKFNYLYDKMTTVLTDTIYVHVCGFFELEYPDDPETVTYKIWRVNNVLCHIYLICNVLDDTETVTDEWKFYQRGSSEPYAYLFSDLLGQNVIIEDTNSASPASLEWISGDFTVTEMPAPPTQPTEVKEPVMPVEVTKPTEPAAVASPGEAPTPVEQPPSAMPELEQKDLVMRTEAYLEGLSLSERSLPQSTAITLNKTISKSIDRQNVYYNYDGEVVPEGQTPTRPSTEQYTYVFDKWEEIGDGEYIACYTEQLRQYTAVFKDGQAEFGRVVFYYGTQPQYAGTELPTREQTATKTYVFHSWVLVEKNSNEWIYSPLFVTTARLYEIRWSILGSVQSLMFEYEDTLTPPTVPSIQYIDGSIYEFIGWDSEPEASVTQSKTYTAQFKKTDLVIVPPADTEETEGTEDTEDTEAAPDSSESESPSETEATEPSTTEGAEDSSEETDVSETTDSDMSEETDGSSDFVGVTVYPYENQLIVTANATELTVGGLLGYADAQSKQVVIRLPQVTLNVDNTAIHSLSQNGAHNIKIIRSPQRSSGGIGYVFTDAQGNTVDFDGKITLTLSNSLGTTQGFYMKGTHADGTIEYLSPSVNEKTVAFAAAANVIYTQHRYYTLTIAAAKGGAVFTQGTLYRAGDTVNIDLRPNSEYIVGSISVVGGSTNLVLDIADRAFVMPEDDVTLTVEFVQRLYTVTFIANGQVISSSMHALGEKITPPEVALTYEKDGFIYSFKGWSQPVGVVTSDVTYTANYTVIQAELHPDMAEGTALRRIILEQLIPIGCLILLLVASIIVLCVVLKKAIKKRKKSARRGKTDE